MAGHGDDVRHYRLSTKTVSHASHAQPASWRPDAKWRSGPGSSEPVCTGRSQAQRHHRSALLQTQRTFWGFLGTSLYFGRGCCV